MVTRTLGLLAITLAFQSKAFAETLLARVPGTEIQAPVAACRTQDQAFILSASGQWMTSFDQLQVHSLVPRATEPSESPGSAIDAAGKLVGAVAGTPFVILAPFVMLMPLVALIPDASPGYESTGPLVQAPLTSIPLCHPTLRRVDFAKPLFQVSFPKDYQAWSIDNAYDLYLLARLSNGSEGIRVTRPNAPKCASADPVAQQALADIVQSLKKAVRVPVRAPGDSVCGTLLRLDVEYLVKAGTNLIGTME